MNGRIAALERKEVVRGRKMNKAIKGILDELDRLREAIPAPTPPPPPPLSMFEIDDQLSRDRAFRRKLTESVLKDLKGANFITATDLEAKLREVQADAASTPEP